MQFDVLYCGDERFNPDSLDPEALARYRTILLPEARDLGRRPAAALEGFARGGGNVVTYSESPIAEGLAVRADGEALTRFWHDYLDADRELIVDALRGLPVERIEVSDPSVRVTRVVAGPRHVVHLLAYGYDEATDSVAPVRDLELRLPWTEGDPRVSLVTPARSARSPRRSRGICCASRCRRSTLRACSWRTCPDRGRRSRHGSITIGSSQSGIERPGIRRNGGSSSGTASSSAAIDAAVAWAPAAPPRS